MRYRNRQTGNVIDVPCPVSGPDWEEIPEREETAGKEAVKPKRGTRKKGD
jgi:hypothetical protein